MKLYHGNPKLKKVISPRQAKGLTKFENQKAVFLCKTFHHAALYAISKSLKGKTTFAVTPKRIIIVGDNKPSIGYVYEVNVNAKKGPRQQYSYSKSITEFKVKKIFPKDYLKNIIHVKTKEELKKNIK
ncbi:MAG: hypothetical protein ABIB79_02035 [archaeon]